MKKKNIITISLCIILLFSMFIGCSSGSNESYQDVAKEEMSYDMEAPMAPIESEAKMEMEYEEAVEESAVIERDGGTNSDSTILTSDRKLIYYANYSIETKQFDADYETIMTKLNEMGGYVQESSVHGQKPTEYGQRGRDAYLILRIPVGKYTMFIDSLSGIGDTVSKSQSTEDVSAQYFDTESRINILEIKLERLEEILEKSTEIKDVIEIENAISDTMYELDSYKGQKRRLDSLIDYTTISINLMELNVIERISQEEEGLGRRLKDALSNSFDSLIRVFETLIIVLVAGIPVWIFAGIVIFIIVKIRKRRKAKKQKAEEKTKDTKNK